jgi:hypothetical protein
MTEKESLVPYYEEYPKMSIYCPGLTYTEWVGFYASLMVGIMTQAFTNKSRYIETSLASTHKTSTMEDITWAYAVGATNKFMLEFENKNHLFKPAWKTQYFRLFYLIASCCVRSHNFPELEKEQPESIESMTMLQQFFRTSGIGTYSPKTEEGRLLSVDKCVMGPLILASRMNRTLEKWQVRNIEVSICYVVSKSQGELPVFYSMPNDSVQPYWFSSCPQKTQGCFLVFSIFVFPPSLTLVSYLSLFRVCSQQMLPHHGLPK